MEYSETNLVQISKINVLCRNFFWSITAEIDVLGPWMLEFEKLLFIVKRSALLKKCKIWGQKMNLGMVDANFS